MDFIKEHQQKGTSQIDLIKFVFSAQNRIFNSIAVGRGNADLLVDYEEASGTVRKISLMESIK
jgi:hypothetical protein